MIGVIVMVLPVVMMVMVMSDKETRRLLVA